MTEREGAEGSQLSQALDFVPIRQGVSSQGHCMERKSCFVLFCFLAVSYLTFSRSGSNGLRMGVEF